MNWAIRSFGIALLLIVAAESQAQREIVFAEQGGVQLVSIPQPPPAEGLLSTVVQVRAVDSSHELVTFEYFSIAGNVHHAWPHAPHRSNTSWEWSKLPEPDSTYPTDWLAYDSHVLFTNDMIGCCAIGARFTPAETNDGSTTLEIGGQLEPFSEETRTGYGPIRMLSDEGVPDRYGLFFLDKEFQRHAIDFVHIVTDATNPDVQMTLGVLGNGIDLRNYPKFGYETDTRNVPMPGTPIPVPFVVPEPSGLALMLYAALALVAVRKPTPSRITFLPLMKGKNEPKDLNSVEHPVHRPTHLDVNR